MSNMHVVYMHVVGLAPGLNLAVKYSLVST